MVVLFLALLASAASAQPYILVDNFTAAPPSNPPAIVADADFGQPKVGLASGRFTYTIDPKIRVAPVDFPDPSRSLGTLGPGTLKVWIKGDGSGNEIEFIVRHAKVTLNPDGTRVLSEQTDTPLPRVKLDFTDWKEVAIDATALPAGHTAWWQRFAIYAPPDVPASKGVEAKTAKLTGTIWLDDARYFPSTGQLPSSIAVATLIGPSVRGFTSDITFALDVRRFGGDPQQAPARISARITMTDRNENLVADRDFAVTLAANESKETKLAMAPENLGLYLPPFRLAGDVLSTDLQDISAKVDTMLVMGNALALVDDMSDVNARWYTYGTAAAADPRANPVNWAMWCAGEYQRCFALVQTTATMSRVDLPPAPPGIIAPPTGHALKLDFTGDAFVYNGLDRYLPGNPYKLGVWVKGDHSGASLYVLTLDYTDGADFWYGGWKRITNGERLLCTLDFDGWKYIEVDLPGNGIGSNTTKGSSDAIDFPLEVTAFRVQTAGYVPPTPPPPGPPGAPAGTAANPGNPGKPGSVLIGPIYVHTQVAIASTLSTFIAYDDPDHIYNAKAGATVTVHNAWRTGQRKVRSNWTLLDRNNDVISSGQGDLDLTAEHTGSFRIELAPMADKIAPRLGPLMLQVNSADASDGSIAATRSIAIAKPDSATLLTSFETDRGYLGLVANGVPAPPPVGEPANTTSTAQHFTGNRSLAIQWDKERHAKTFTSVDPQLPGVPTEISMQVYGDNSGVLFYPLIGDRRGVNKGTPNGLWDLFLPRPTTGPLAAAVKVDWTGWKELHFKLPVVPPTWNVDLPVYQFTPSYPLGIHLGVEVPALGSVPWTVSAAGGTIYVDDIKVVTQLPPAQRLAIALDRPSETNIIAAGTVLTASVTNRDATTPRTAKITGGVFDWRSKAVFAVKQDVPLAPGQTLHIPVAANLPAGAYMVRATLSEGDQKIASIDEDLLLADLTPVLPKGVDFNTAVRDEWKLRPAIRETFAYVDEDWDWVEFYPGNLQLDTLRSRLGQAIGNGAAPYELLGFSSYWAAGIGFDQFKNGPFIRPVRHRGAAIDIFQVPARIEDWDDYMMEVIRGVGDMTAGWMIWDNPGGESSLSVPPEKFAAMLASADKWRREYTPDKPLIIGGMSRASAIPYLTELAKHGALAHLSGVNVRLDVGRLSPEDAQMEAYVQQLRATLQPTPQSEAKTVLLSDLDWAVETSDTGLNGFDQAAYLARSDLILNKYGIKPIVSIRNEDYDRFGTGLIYRRVVSVPPMSEKPLAYQFKPGWWALSRTRSWLEQLQLVGEVEIQDTVPGRTRCLLYTRKTDQRPVAIVWRNDDPGYASFEPAGLTVESAQDMFSAPVVSESGWFSVGKMPTVFVLAVPGAGGEPVVQALARLRVRDTADAAWPQRTLASFTPGSEGAKRQSYTQSGSAPAVFEGKSAYAPSSKIPGVAFASGGSESFTVDVPAGSGLVLRKRYFLDDKGQAAKVLVNGKEVGDWDLSRSAAELSKGVRDAIYVIGPAAIGGARAAIELRYPQGKPANTIAWVVDEYKGGPFPITAVGPLHADQSVGQPRPGRNMVGGNLQIGTTPLASGLGVFAQSLLEYPLNRQFKTFTARVGIDAVTDGKGSVVFEVYADGKKVYASGVMSGLEQARDVKLDVTGVNRLRLVVTDAGDGNKFDAGDWGEAALQR